MVTSKNKVELLYKDEVYRIIGTAFEVYNELGPGFLEAIDQDAMQLEFVSRAIPHTAQSPLRVMYKGQPLKKHYIADFVCFSCVMVEIKAQAVSNAADEAQLLNEMKATGLRVGVLINFGAKGELEWKRLVL